MRVLITLLLLISPKLLAQNFPKREFRGAWIATVSNIDYPSSKFLTAAQQQSEFISLLNRHQQAGINAVLVQIRTNSDALYDSTLEPWSEWLTGKQGQNPGYDPLPFMIAECRKRNMEFHAWFNPYRAVSNVKTSLLDSTKHVAVKHPEWLLAFGDTRILNPGHPEVRNWVTKVVMDVVRRYDIDGVHFDDYFYPYPATGLSFNDNDTYAQYHRGIANRADWRRDNVNLLIKQVADSIKTAKPYIKFGISPFGIWQNKSASQPQGSDTRGLQAYHDIYADAPLWIQQGWVDYLAPQLYWYIGYTVADYALLTPWWNARAANRHIYVGQATYRVGADANWDANQIPKQIRLNRTYANIAGSIFYNTSSINKNTLGVRDSLLTTYFKYPALQPLMAWKSTSMPTPPTDLVARTSSVGVQLTWASPIVAPAAAELEKVRSYVVYRFLNNDPIDLNNAKAIKGIVPATETAFMDTDGLQHVSATYVVTALNRLHAESTPSNAVRVAKPLAQLTEQESFVLEQNAPNPFHDHTLIRYRIPRAGHVRIRLLDVFGKTVAILVDRPQPDGRHEVLLHADNLRAGAYFYSLEFENKRLIKRLLAY